MGWIIPLYAAHSQLKVVFPRNWSCCLQGFLCHSDIYPLSRYRNHQIICKRTEGKSFLTVRHCPLYFSPISVKEKPGMVVKESMPSWNWISTSFTLDVQYRLELWWHWRPIISIQHKCSNSLKWIVLEWQITSTSFVLVFPISAWHFGADSARL